MAQRLELAIGILSSLTANIHYKERFEAKDFIVDWEEKYDREQEDEVDDGGLGAMRRLSKYQEQISAYGGR